MITVDDSGRQLTVHFGGGTLAVKTARTDYRGEPIAAIIIEQLDSTCEAGRPVPEDAKAVGSTIVLAFHNFAGLAVVEAALARCRKRLEAAIQAAPGPVKS